MGKRLEIFGDVGIVDETNCFGLDVVDKTGVDFGAPDMEAPETYIKRESKRRIYKMMPQTWRQTMIHRMTMCYT